MTKVVKTDKAPGAIGPYSQGIDIGNMIFFSGQIPLDPETGVMPEGIEAQTRRALDNVKGLLESYPARSAVEVAKLPKGALLEVEVVAVK